MRRLIELFFSDKKLYLFDLSSSVFYQFNEELELLKEQKLPDIDSPLFEIIKVSDNDVLLYASIDRSPNIISINLKTNKATPLLKLPYPYIGAYDFLIRDNYLYFKVVTNKFKLYIVRISTSVF